MHLVGYSYGAVLAAATRTFLVTSGIALVSLAFVCPLPFGSSPSDLPQSENTLIASARLYDTLISKLRYFDQEGYLAAAVQAGDVTTMPALIVELYTVLPSHSAHEEISRIARYLMNYADMTVDWNALPKLDDLPIMAFKTEGGPAYFRSRHRANWNHADGIYGWSTLRPRLLSSQPTVLKGGHFDAFSGQENLAALSDGVAALVRYSRGYPPGK